MAGAKIHRRRRLSHPAFLVSYRNDSSQTVLASENLTKPVKDCKLFHVKHRSGSEIRRWELSNGPCGTVLSFISSEMGAVPRGTSIRQPHFPCSGSGPRIGSRGLKSVFHVEH